MLIRRETAADRPAIHAVTVAAFGRALEADLLDALRADPGWLPPLSMVAVDGAEIIGHVVCTRATVGDVPALGLGPLSVAPERQNQGVGLALVHAMLGAADALGEPLVALVGDPAYYVRYGFRLSVELGVIPPHPSWERHFQVRTLTEWSPAIKGQFTYCAPFNDL